MLEQMHQMSYIKRWNSTFYWLIRLLALEQRGMYYPGRTVLGKNLVLDLNSTKNGKHMPTKFEMVGRG